MEILEKEKREKLILSALMERRVSVEEETKRLRAELTDIARREQELRDEILTLDAILGALPQPPKENEAPSLFTPTPPPAPPAAAPPSKKRRRKGSRREQMMPVLKEKFGAGVFGVDDVTDLLLVDEPGERRKAYFAAWSLCRDLAEDGLILTVSEEGSGKRMKRTFRFGNAGKPAA
jgi:hypothetical protein